MKIIWTSVLNKCLLLIAGIIMLLSFSGCGTATTPVENKSGWTLFSSGNQVNMLITKGDEIWAATAGGVEMWNQKTGTGRLYTIEDGLPENYIWGITQDNSGVIWAITNFNACFFNGTGWTTSLTEKNTISALINDHPGNDWVLCATLLVRLYSGYPQLFSPAANTLPLPNPARQSGGVLSLWHGEPCRRASAAWRVGCAGVSDAGSFQLAPVQRQ